MHTQHLRQRPGQRRQDRRRRPPGLCLQRRLRADSLVRQRDPPPLESDRRTSVLHDRPRRSLVELATNKPDPRSHQPLQTTRPSQPVVAVLMLSPAWCSGSWPLRPDTRPARSWERSSCRRLQRSPHRYVGDPLRSALLRSDRSSPDRYWLPMLRAQKGTPSKARYDTRDTVLACYSGAGFDPARREEGPDRRPGRDVRPTLKRTGRGVRSARHG
jgi:hypothetical protein